MPIARHPRRNVVATFEFTPDNRPRGEAWCGLAPTPPCMTVSRDAQVSGAYADTHLGEGARPLDESPGMEVRTMVQSRRNVLSLATVLGTVVALVGVPVASGATQKELSGQSVLLSEMNAARADHGLAPLRVSQVLARPARSHSVYLARTGKLDHDGADGKPFYVRLYRAGYSKKKTVGENLGISSGCETDLAKTMVRMWLDSPGHRANLLSTRFKAVGLAVVAASDCSNTVYTTDFGG